MLPLCRVGLKAAADFQVASPIDMLTKAEVTYKLQTFTMFAVSNTDWFRVKKIEQVCMGVI